MNAENVEPTVPITPTVTDREKSALSPLAVGFCSPCLQAEPRGGSAHAAGESPSSGPSEDATAASGDA